MTRIEIDLARKEAAKLAPEVLTAYEYGEGVADAISAIAKALRDAYDRGWSDGVDACSQTSGASEAPMALDFDKLRRAAECQRSSPRLRWNELTREVQLPLSDSAIAAAGSNRPRATALAMIAAYEALPELLDTIERLRADLGRRP